MKSLKERIAKGIQEAPTKEENYNEIVSKAEAYLNQTLDALEGVKPKYEKYCVIGGTHALTNAEIIKITGDDETLLLVEVSESRVRVQPDDYDAIVLNDEDAATVREVVEVLKASKFATFGNHSQELPEGLDTLIQALKSAVGGDTEVHVCGLKSKLAGSANVSEFRHNMMVAITMEKLGLTKEQSEEVVKEFEGIMKDLKL